MIAVVVPAHNEEQLIARVIRGDGTPEAAWQAWPRLARLQRISLDHCVRADARLVIVAPHPDDEVLACGALLALHAARGGRCLVVAVTDGEASHRGDGDWTASRLAAARRAESVDGLKRLGVAADAVVRLGLADGQLAGSADRLTADIESLLVAGDAVVTTWRQDGHPDHEATGRATAQACARRRCRLLEAPVWMWHWAVPDDPRVPWQRLRALPLPPEAQARKREALAAHATQLAPRDAGTGPVLGAGVLERLQRSTEHFLV